MDHTIIENFLPETRAMSLNKRTLSSRAAFPERGCAEMTVDKPKALRAPSEIDLRVSARLKAARRAAGLTLVELAGRVGLSHQQLQKYEQGKNRISAGSLYFIASELGVPLTAFFESAQASLETPIERVRKQADHILSRIPDGDMARVVRVLKALRD
ncbi:helix-turn-helix transcriptional regulator [Hyphomonas chukchiensis]|uniref:helix-turn-helix domain-containing protein n=1 Tax=Hyphomonas chukchiensis TaxID=1280947 RepID=UPI0030FBE643